MSKVLCFGEILLRLSPSSNGFDQNPVPVYLGGAELNTAVALSRWGVPVSFFTALPDHFLAENIRNDIRSYGIDTSRIFTSGDRVGTYYLPEGSDLKSGKVVYDRMHTSFAGITLDDIDWNKVFDGVGWFHFSAITPALNPSLAEVSLRAVETASAAGIKISVDLNYREKLWTYGKSPIEIMPEIVSRCDYVMGNLWAAEKMLGLPLPASSATSKNNYLKLAELCSREFIDRFPKCSQLANTFRFEHGNEIRYYATLYNAKNLFVSREHNSKDVIDRVGSGDSFMAGFVYGNLMNFDHQSVVDFAAAAAFKKLFIKGDASTASLEDVKKAAKIMI
ncbi:MAG: PfkB family carbohydrate kinase [Flavisolibacter sp.]